MNSSESFFNNILIKNTSQTNTNQSNQIDFILKYYRPKCDICNKLCENDWRIQKPVNNHKVDLNDSLYKIEEVKEHNHLLFLICNICYVSKNFPQDITKESFECSNFNSMLNKVNESKNYLNNYF